MRKTWVSGLISGWGRSLEEGMAAHSSILAWRIPWTEEPGGLQSTGSQRVRHHWRDLGHMCLGKETQRVPFKLQGEKSSVSITSTLFLRPYALCSPPGPACWQWKRKTEGEFLAKGTAAALIFNHETTWQGHSFAPSKMRGGGNTGEPGSGRSIWTVSGCAHLLQIYFF